MPRIIFEVGPNNRYIIWCDESPPPIGGGPGNLVIPNVERKEENGKKFLYIPRLADDLDPVEPDDIHIKLYEDPKTNFKLILPYDGAKMGPLDPPDETEFTRG